MCNDAYQEYADVVRDDNRTENLRLATPAQNATNKSTKSKATSKSATGY